MGEGDGRLSPRGARRLLERSGRYAALRGARGLRPVLETAGPATAEEHLVRNRRAMAWLPSGSPGENPGGGRDVQLLEQWRREHGVSVRYLALLFVPLLSAPDLQLFEALEPHMGALTRLQL